MFSHPYARPRPDLAGYKPKLTAFLLADSQVDETPLPHITSKAALMDTDDRTSSVQAQDEKGSVLGELEARIRYSVECFIAAVEDRE